MLERSALTNSERINWIRLYRSENVGAKTFKKLIELYGTATDALNNIEKLASNGGLERKFKICSVEQVKEEIEKTSQYGAEIICSSDHSYPKKLTDVDDSPPVIIVKGSLTLLENKKAVAIVGARNASMNGCMFAKNIANVLGKKNVVIVSGLAIGIDTFAHEGSLDAGTIAVIAGGIDNIYPKQNKKLFDKIPENGAIISELPIGTAPLARHFPQRNRIIAGLSDVTLVVEAALKSGSLITAEYAKSQNRTVFAVPGTPIDPRHRGTNSLLKTGAKIAESAEDILDFLNSNNNKTLFESPSNYNAPKAIIPSESELSKHRSKLLECLTYSATSLDDIAEQTNIPLNVINLLVLELELAGKVYRSYGNKLCLSC